MSAVLRLARQQARANTAWKAAADARQYATPDDDALDYLDYPALVAQRIDAWLEDIGHGALIGEVLGNDPEGARLLRTLIGDLDARIRGAKPAGDLIHDMRHTIRQLSARVATLAYTPICNDIDDDARRACDAARQMRRYGQVEP